MQHFTRETVNIYIEIQWSVALDFVLEIQTQLQIEYNFDFKIFQL